LAEIISKTGLTDEQVKKLRLNPRERLTWVSSGGWVLKNGQFYYRLENTWKKYDRVLHHWEKNPIQKTIVHKTTEEMGLVKQLDFKVVFVVARQSEADLSKKEFFYVKDVHHEILANDRYGFLSKSVGDKLLITYYKLGLFLSHQIGSSDFKVATKMSKPKRISGKEAVKLLKSGKAIGIYDESLHMLRYYFKGNKIVKSDLPRLE